MKRNERALNALVCGVLLCAPASAGRCDLDVVPAATLLIPYFELDLEDPNGRTTLFSVVNALSSSVLAKVTLWTDWAVPSISFEVYLTGFDIQTFNVRDFLVLGRVSQTGSGVSPQGPLSDPNAQFPECNAGSEPGEPPVYPGPFLAGAVLEEVRALHTGAQGPLSGKCGGYPFGDGIARGYITIDTVNRCSDLTPADEGYFGAGGSGVASDLNALFGDYFYVTFEDASAKSEMAVHIEAFPGGFGEGDKTFYGRYVANSGADDREPVGNTYGSRHIVGGPFTGGTTFVVWRDTGSADAEPITCAEEFMGESPVPNPAWYPLGTDLFHFDEEENGTSTILDVCADPWGCDFAFPNATQAFPLLVEGTGLFEIPLDPGFGFGMSIIGLTKTPWDETPLEGWVSAIVSATDLYSVGQRAVRLGTACTE